MSLGGRIALKTMEIVKDPNIKGVGLIAPYIQCQTIDKGVQFRNHINQIIEMMYPNLLNEQQLSDLQKYRRQ